MNVTPFAPAARAAFGRYAAFPRRRDAAEQLADRLGGMLTYASGRSEAVTWTKVANQLFSAMYDVQKAAAARRRRRALTRIALETVWAAIEAFELAYAVSLQYDDHDRYNPAPGTEYPFSVSDIGRAAVQLLGPDWHAESTPWGVGAGIEHKDEKSAYLLAVDYEGDLYVADYGRGGSSGSGTEVEDATASDGLNSLAHRVAELVLSLHTTGG